jgi:hypothetical protein
MTEIKKKVSLNSLNSLRPAPSSWQDRNTRPIRIPIKINEKVLKYAHLLDKLTDEEINDLFLVSKKEIFEAIEKTKKSKQSLIIGLERLTKNLNEILKSIDKI